MAITSPCSSISWGAGCAIAGRTLYKLSLFRRGQGRFECRLKDQDASMADMEIHEHVVVAGSTAKMKNPLVHHNVESLSRYIQKHDEYSNWEARVWLQGEDGYRDLPPALFGSQAQRRRWLRKTLFGLPGSPLSVVSVQVRVPAGLSGRHSGSDLLHFSRHPVFSRQSEDLRTAHQAKG